MTPHPPSDRPGDQDGRGAARAVRVGRVKRPDLFDVLEVVREWPDCQSYVYRNKLAAKGHRDLATALVLRRLKKLEALGRVQRRSWACGFLSYWLPVCEPIPTPTGEDGAVPHLTTETSR